MKKIIIVTLLLGLYSSAVYSQGNKYRKIEKYCNKVDSIINLDSDIHTAYMVHSINFETNKRAIGKQNTTVKFYYPMPIDSVVESEKGTDFIYIYKPPAKISVEYNIAASQNIVISYYFNEKGKLLLYWYQSKGEYGCVDTKKYFDKNKLIRESELKLPDCNSSDAEVKQKNSFTEVRILDNVKTYIKMFNELIKTEQLDK